MTTSVDIPQRAQKTELLQAEISYVVSEVTLSSSLFFLCARMEQSNELEYRNPGKRLGNVIY